MTPPLRPLLSAGLFLPLLLASPLRAADVDQKRIVADFEDLGTWRCSGGGGLLPEAWFAGGSFLAGSLRAADHDRCVGEARFAFDTGSPGPFRIDFSRQKIALVSGFLDGIEFDADGKGLPVSIRFVLADAAGKRFATVPVPLSNGWHPYRIDLDEKTLPGLGNVRFPAHLAQVSLVATQACAGSVFLDDLALIGEFARKDQVSVFPLADGLAYVPGQPVPLRYRLRNALPTPLPATLHVSIRDFGGREVFSGTTAVTIPAWGQAMAEAAVPALPAGPYSAVVIVDAGKLQVAYDDTFGVFVPNGHRLNHRSMWFGINDGMNLHGEAQQEQHLAWLRELGADLVRVQADAGRLEPLQDRFAFAPWQRFFDAAARDDVGVQLMYIGTPAWTQGEHVVPRGIPDDLGAYARHVAALGTFLARYPAVKYLEFWNEPDIGFFQGDLDGFLRMFHAFSEAFRPVAPGIRLVGPGVTVIHPKEKAGFSQGVIQRGAADYDVAGFHAHGPLGNYVEREELVEKWMADAGIGKPIANTEAGERSGYDARGRASQAVTLVKKMAYAKSRPHAEFYTWYCLQDYWDMDADADDSWGMVTSDNRVKPAFLAYNALVRELADTAPIQAAPFDARIETRSFRRDDGSTISVCWPAGGSAGETVWLHAAPGLRCDNMFGTPQPLSSLSGLVPVPFGSEPLYLVVPAGTPPLSVAEPLVAWDGAPQPSGEGSVLPIRLRNPGSTPLSGELSVEDASGKRLWSQTLSVAADGTSTIKAMLPGGPGPEGGAVTFSANGESIRLPLRTVDSYPIRKAQDNPMAPASEAFVNGLPKLKLDRREDVAELAFDPSILSWQGPDDLSVEARACHDDGGIYFRFDVTDDKHVPPASPSALWKGDSVQLALAAPGANRYAIVSLGLTADGPVAWCDEAADAAGKGRWDVPLRIERRGKVTTYHVYIPFAQAGLPPSPRHIRFAFLVNEDDGQGRVRWMHWHDGIGKGENADLLGFGTLEP